MSHLEGAMLPTDMTRVGCSCEPLTPVSPTGGSEREDIRSYHGLTTFMTPTHTKKHVKGSIGRGVCGVKHRQATTSLSVPSTTHHTHHFCVCLFVYVVVCCVYSTVCFVVCALYVLRQVLQQYYCGICLEFHPPPLSKRQPRLVLTDRGVLGKTLTTSDHARGVVVVVSAVVGLHV